MDTKPHGQFPFNDILDTLEYDLQSPQRQYSGTASSPQGYQADDDKTHTFKIVTTKRTLLLCAPSEDDEIKWMGAIRALMARRTDSGLVPGQTKLPPSQGSSGVPQVTTSASAGTGIKGKVRRMSFGIPYPEQEMREAKTS